MERNGTLGGGSHSQCLTYVVLKTFKHVCVCVCVFKVFNITWMYLRQLEHDFVESNVFPSLCGFLGLNSHCQACSSRILSCGLSHWLSKLIANLTTMFPNHHSSTGDQTQSPSTSCRGALLLVRYMRYMMNSNEFTYEVIIDIGWAGLSV